MMVYLLVAQKLSILRKKYVVEMAENEQSHSFKKKVCRRNIFQIC